MSFKIFALEGEKRDGNLAIRNIQEMCIQGTFPLLPQMAKKNMFLDWKSKIKNIDKSTPKQASHRKTDPFFCLVDN